MTYITIIVPCYNEEKYIKQCIESIFQSDYPRNFYEVIMIDGNSSDNTVNIIREHKEIILLHNPKKIVPISMNMGLEIAKGEYIIRLDAHSYFPKDYFSKLIRFAIELNSDNIGGVCVTKPKVKTNKSVAICEVLINRFGVGNSLFRIGANKILEVDTVPFGCFKRNVFEKFGLYDSRLERNQDLELNKRIKKGGGRIFLVPSIHCIYFARETFGDLARNNFANGLWNIKTVIITNTFSSLSLRHFVPLFFLLSLIIPLILMVIWKGFFLVTLVVLLAYLLVTFYVSIPIVKSKKINIFLVIYSFFVLHLSYGFGSLVGFFR